MLTYRVNWKRTSPLATLGRPGKSLPFTSTPPGNYFNRNAPITYFLSSTSQKSAQLIETNNFQVPVFCGTCALFPWKPSVFNILTKNTRVIVSATVNQKPKARLEVLEPGQIIGTRRGRRPPSLINNLGIYGDGGRFFETLSLQRSSV